MMEGRTCLVTGATSGHGRAVARSLAGMGADVILMGRSRERCEETREEIERETGRRPDLVLCDLSSRDEIARAVGEILGMQRPLHVLVNNAGVVMRERTETVDGVETTLAVNYLSHFQLTLGLLGRIVESGKGRIVNVSSDTHRMVSLDLDDLELRRGYGFMKAYGVSKLALVYFTLELSRRLEGRGVTVNALDPGPVASGIGQNNPGVSRDILRVVMRLFFADAMKAARTAVWLASSPEVEGVTGGYFKWLERREPRVGDPETGRRLWRISEAMTGARYA